MVVNGRGMLVEFKDRGELWDSNTVDRIEWGIIEPFRDRAQLMRWPASSAARQGLRPALTREPLAEPAPESLDMIERSFAKGGD
jgi:hypothetical protein